MATELSETDIAELLANTEALASQIYVFTHNLSNPPGKSHRGTAIAFSDILEKRTDFVRELRNTTNSWVYSKKRFADLMERELGERHNDLQNAYSQIEQMVREKFRPGQPQGQFGELLLFNFLQHFFSAAPLLRKMPITTSRGMERYGADAIHYAISGDSEIFYLGEAKCYVSDYRFNAAFDNAIESILNTFNNLLEELELYAFDDFVEEPLREVARALKANKKSNVRFELVVVIAYNETTEREGHNESEIYSRIQAIIEKRYERVKTQVSQKASRQIIDRLHYVVFPVWGLESLLDDFVSR